VPAWEKAAKPLRFVPSHPMAGSEFTGWEHAKADLFKNAPCILTPTAKTDSRALAQVSALWKRLGCRLKRLSPARHDQLIGRFSHLTHALAFALSKSASRGVKKADFSVAGPSYWGNTRIAASDPGLWADIFEYNRKALLPEIAAAISELKRLRGLRGGALIRELEKISLAARKARA